VVLLMKLTGDGSTSGGLFSGEDGRLLSEFRCSDSEPGLPRWLELWQTLSSDGPPEMARPEDTAEADITEADATEPTYAMEHLATKQSADRGPEHFLIRATGELPENPVVHEPRWPRRRISLLAATAILAALVAYPTFKMSARLRHGAGISRLAVFQAQSPGPQYSGFALRVERQGDNLRLDWDRTAPVLAAATGGMLTIRDGKGQAKQVLLDVNLLRTGAVIYQPVHGDLFLRLVIFGQNGAKIGESVATYPQRTSAIGSHPYKESQ